MTTNAALAVTSEQGFWDDKQLAALKQIGLGNAPKGDLAVFLHYAQRTGLDPFARQIYMIARGGNFQIQTSIDGFRIVAQRSGKYAGQTKSEWCGDDGVWKEVWLSKDFPSAARVGVYNKDFAEPLYAIAKWDSFAVVNSPMWKKMPDLMLAKCAEALALRKAFPQDLSGIYTAEEMEQTENPAPSRFVVTDEKAISIEPPVVELKEQKVEVDDELVRLFVKQIAEASSVTALRSLYREAEKVGILDEQVNETMTMRELIITARDEKQSEAS